VVHEDGVGLGAIAASISARLAVTPETILRTTARPSTCRPLGP
jgi:hypothetical protein